MGRRELAEGLRQQEETENEVTALEGEEEQVGIKNAQCLLAMILHTTNLVFQGTMLFWIFAFSIQSRKDKLEAWPGLSGCIETLEMVLETQRALNVSSPIESRTLEQCQSDLTVRHAQFIVILLWGVKSLPECVASLLVFRTLWMLPSSHESDGDHEAGSLLSRKDGKFLVTHMQPALRVFLTLAVNLPRLVIGYLTWFIGAMFLMYASTLEALVMKSLSLSFVVTIDDIMFSELASREMRTIVMNATISYNRPCARCHK